MPEGDTIFRLARDLSPLMTGQTIRRASGVAPLLSRLEGATIVSVTSRGKHLLVGVSREAAEAETFVRTHLGMHGAWHTYDHGARLRRPERRASLVLETERHRFLCFDAKEVDCFRASHLETHPRLARLGPDLLDPAHDLDEVVKRFRARGVDHLAHLLLDQSVASGIGNVYKSEVLFLTGHLPLTLSSVLAADDVRRMYRTARELLKVNSERWTRITTGARPGSRRPRLWVYERVGRPCFRCESLIRHARTPDARPTFWCPICQR